MTENDPVAYKILGPGEWETLERDGVFPGSPADLADGFIHLSTRDQVAGTAARHFAGRQGLVLAAVDIAAYGDLVRWEPSRGGALFPHLYGLLTRDRVGWAEPMPLVSGVHRLPAQLDEPTRPTDRGRAARAAAAKG